MANLRNTVVTGSLRLASHGAGMVRTDANGTISTAAMTAGDLPSHNHDDRYYTESEINSLLSAKQDTATAITTSNIGSQSVNYANSAGTSGQVSGVSVSSLQMQYLKNTLDPSTLPYTCDIYVDGDANTYYPVHFIWGDQDVWRRIVIKRGYGEEAPWDPIGTGSHHGGLLLDWEGNFGGWGGAEYSDRLRVFNESYTNVCADMYIYTHSMGYVFMLRGGHALYHIFSDQPIRGYHQTGTPDIAYNTSTLFYDHSNTSYRVYAPSPVTTVNSSRIDGLRTKKQSLFDNRYLRQGVDINGIGSITTTNSYATNFMAANAFYLNGQSYYLNSYNGGIYTNARFESASNIYMSGNLVATQAWVQAQGYRTTDSDNQTLSVSGSTLTISGGNSVTMPSGGISQGDADARYLRYTGAELTEGNYFYYRSNRGSYLGELNSASLQVYATGGNSAFMSFHRSGNYAVNFGLDADNVMRIGGWSASADRWVLDMSGNNTVAGSFRAPIFYDSADTTYYGDFAGTSWLRHLSVGDVNASNDGGWNARLNLTGSSHARLDVKSNSDGIITTMYSHTGQGVGRVGTSSNHPLAFMVNGGIAGYAYANYLQGVDSVRAPIFYDSQNTNYYVDPNSNSYLSRLHVADASSGVSMHVGLGSTHGVYTLDNDRKYLVVSGEYYPHMALVARSANNTNHGAVFSFVGTEGSSPRQWNLGIANQNPFIFSIGYNTTNDTNPHYGVGDGWSSNDANHARLSIDRSGNTKIRGMLYVNGTSGGISTGSAVIHAGNIGSQSVSYATTSGALTSMNISQFTNNSGYITSGDTTTGIFTTFLGNGTSNIGSGYTRVIRNENGLGGNPNYAPILHIAASDTMWQIAGPHAGQTNLVWRSGYAGAWDTPWWTILHTGNYTSFAPSLTGTGASGTWGISITGNANTATTAGALTSMNISQFTNNSGYITGSYVVANGTSAGDIDADWGQSFKTFDPVPSGTPPLASPNIRTINVGENYARRTQLAFNYSSDQAWFRRRQDSTWYTWREFIHSGNIGSQSVNYASSANYATSAGNSDTVDGYHESSFWRDGQNRVIGVLRFTGEGGDSGNGSLATSYGIYQQGGAWTHPYPDLCIGFHTGIKIGAHYSYQGTRFYNNSDWATEIFSVGNGDNHVRVQNNLYVYGNTYLGDGNGDEVHINDILRVGATDSGDAHIFFGEGGSAGSDYGAHLYWDSGYTFTWNTRNAGTDTRLFSYVTNDTTYLYWNRHHHLENKELNYVGQLHLNNGFALQQSGSYGYINNWLKLGTTGIFSDTNSAHIYPNTSTSYGSWRMDGSRGGWRGINFAGNVTLMMNDNETGFYRDGYGWQWRWENGTGYIYKNGQGGGTSAAILDSSNWTNYVTTLQGYSASALVTQSRGMHSGSDFPNGTLVRTSIDANGWAGNSFVMEVSGKSYGSGTPFKLVMEGYLYADTIINVSAMSYGSYFPGGLVVFRLDGKLCFWWARGSYWNSFEVHVRSADGESWNRVTSIGDSPDPGGDKRVGCTPTQVVHSGNIGSQSVNYASSAGNSAQLNGLSKIQLWNNSGQGHGTYQTFGAIPNFGVWFMQGSGAADTPQAGSQYYVQTQGLGNDYAYGTYGLMTAVARNHDRKYTYYRTQEGGSWGSWTKAAAGYADEAGTANAVAWTNVSGRPTALSQFTNDLTFTSSDTLQSVTNRGASTSAQVSFTKTDDHAISVGTIRGRAVGSQTGEFIQLYERVNIGGPSGWGASNTSAPSFGLSVYGGANIGYGNNASLFAYAYRGNGNVGGTGEASWHPAGIYSGGTQWFYGTTYRNNAATYDHGNLYFSGNYGYGIVGLYNASRYQAVFAMGDSYRLPIDGTTTGNLYGLAWSHPNAGGVASNLNSHGLLVMENGTFLAAISGSIRARDDVRAPALYDSGSRVAISRGEGRDYVNYSRYVYNNGAYSGSGWIEPSDLGVRYAASAGSASTARYLPTYYVGGQQTNPQVYFNNGVGFNVAMTGAWSVWSDTLWINGYSGGDVPWMCALHFLRNSEPRMAISAQRFDSSGYGSYYEVITAYNIASQTVASAGNATTAGGLAVHGGRNNEVNKIVRTDANGYIQAGWINTTSGAFSSGINKIYCSDDDYMRYQTPANFISNLGLITTGNIGSQSVNYANSAGSAGSVSWGNVSSKPAGWLNTATLVEEIAPSASAFPSGFYQSYLGAGNPTGTWFNYINVRHSNPANGHGYQLGMSYYDNILWFRSYQGGLSPSFQSWAYAISSQNIGSQSVSYATSAGSATSATTASTLSGNATINGLNFGGVFALTGSGASTSNSTGTRMSESYGVLWNFSNSATWHHQIINGSSLVGFQSSGGNYGGGNYYGTGDVTAYYSDERLKTKITTITDAIEKIKSLEGFVYIENDLARSLGYTNEKEQVGVSAQKIQAVLPQAVSLAPFDMQGVPETGEIISKTGENYLTVKYDRIVPLLIEGIKEQQLQIEKMKKQIDELKAKLV